MSGLKVVIVLGLIIGSLAIPTFPETAATDDCPFSDSVKTFPHPTNCSKYYQCENGTKVEMNCTHGMHYNAAVKACDFPRYARCKTNDSLPTTSTQAPVNGSQTTNDTRTSIGKEEFRPKFDQKISERNNTLRVNGPGLIRNGNNSLETNPASTRNANNTLVRILDDSNRRNHSSDTTNSSFNATRSTTNSSYVTKASLETTTHKTILSRNDTKSSNESSGVTTHPNNATTSLNEERTTEDLTEESTESSTGRTTIKKVNVTNGNKLKIADRKDPDETESEETVEDESEAEEEDDKRENEKPVISKKV